MTMRTYTIERLPLREEPLEIKDGKAKRRERRAKNRRNGI